MALQFKTDEEFVKASNEFFTKHPDAPQADDIECLNLIMKKEYARQIVAGTKKLEYRACSDFYNRRLIDERVSQYIIDHINDEEVLTFCNDIRQVKKIHFYSYSNTWHLDVEVDYNGAFSPVKEDIEMLHNEYGVHDWDADFADFERAGVPDEDRPWIFYFSISKILSSSGL